MSIDKQSRTEIIELVVGMFDGAPGAQYLSELMALRANGLSLEGLAEALTQSPAFAAAYSPVLANDEFASKFINNLLGDLVAAEDKAWATDWIEAQLNAGSTKAEVIMTAIAALKGAAGSEQFGAAAEALANKVNVAEWYSVEAGQSATSLEELQGVLAGVTNDPATVDAAKGGNTGTTGDSTLTQQADNVSGDAGDNIFLAPVTQNETGSGQLANTFETGDVIKGGAGNDTLKADLIATGSVAGDYVGVAVSAETDSVENVFLRAQTIQLDPAASNTTFAATVDAEKMAGVEQWWSDNSRANITVEDIRNETSEVTFGMRQTDPNVSFTNFFNPLYLEGDTSATSDMTLNIYEGPAGAPSANELANITVREIAFTVAGEQIVLDTDAIRAADTWAELEDALNAALADIGAADSITLTNRGNGQFVFSDTEGREFQVNEGEALVLSVTNNITVTNSLAVGREEVEGPTSTNVVLDAAGNGSQGGTLTIGAMSGGRGVEVFNIDVDRDSHLSLVQSVNGAAYNNLVPNEYLEVVNLNSIGAKGDLQIGTRSDTLDERAALSADNTIPGDGIIDVFSGLYNVREVNGSTFEGDLNIAIALDNNAIARYLDEAEGDVEFNYTASAGNDLFNIADLSQNGIVSQDQDFTMNIDMGAGDDRLVINVPFVDETTVDGGEGVNSIVVSQSHGINASNTFESFANFQTYEVEGTGNNTANNTAHDFTSMAGVENVVIATDGNTAAGVPPLPTVGDNTTLIDLEADQNVTISGKNQTIGNNSTNTQLFGTITLTDDAGVERTVTLDNTARLSNAAVDGVSAQDGILFVQNLTVNASATGTSATRELTIDSAGERNVANAIGAVNAAGVNTLNLTGTQELTVDVLNLATAPATNQAPLNIDASELTGDLHLGLNGALLNQITGTGTDTILGTDGANDELMLYGAFTNGNNATVTGIETVQLGSYGSDTNLPADATLFGDTVQGLAPWPKLASGTLDTAGIDAGTYNIADLAAAGVTLTNFGNGNTVNIGDANTDVLGQAVNSQTHTEQINIVSSAANAAGTLATVDINRLDVVGTGTATNIALGDAVAGVAAGVGGFRTINLDVARDASLAAAVSDNNLINLDVGSQARTLNLTGGVEGRANDNVAGQADIVDLTVGGNTLTNSLETINLSDYNGQVALDMADVAIGAAQTDVSFVMSGYNAAIDLTEATAGVVGNITHNSVFEFTAAGTTTTPSQWTIDDIVVGGAGNVNNNTLFDLRDLGIANYAQVDVLYVNDGDVTTDLFGNALAANTAVIRSEAQGNDGVETWEIIVTGAYNLALSDAAPGTSITEDNFIF